MDLFVFMALRLVLVTNTCALTTETAIPKGINGRDLAYTRGKKPRAKSEAPQEFPIAVISASTQITIGPKSSEKVSDSKASPHNLELSLAFWVEMSSPQFG